MSDGSDSKDKVEYIEIIAVQCTLDDIAEWGGYSVHGVRSIVSRSPNIETWKKKEGGGHPLYVTVTEENTHLFLKGPRKRHADIVFQRVLADAEGREMPELPHDFGMPAPKPAKKKDTRTGLEKLLAKPPQLASKSKPGLYIIQNGESVEFAEGDTDKSIVELDVNPSVPDKATLRVIEGKNLVEYFIEKDGFEFRFNVGSGDSARAREHVGGPWLKRLFDHYTGKYMDFSKLVTKTFEKARGNFKQLQVMVNGKPETIQLEKEYSAKAVLPILRSIHSGIFTEKAVENIVMRMSLGNRTVKGENLVRYIEQIDGIISISSASAKRKLAPRLGIDESSVEDTLKSDYCRKYVYDGFGISIPGISYVLDNEVSLMAEAIAGHREAGGVPPMDAAKQKWRERLDYVIPDSKVHQSLIERGILRDRDRKVLDSTHEALKAQVAGCRYIDLKFISERAGDSKIYERWMANLVETGVLKEITGNPGTEPFYVLAQQKNKGDIFSALGLDR
jgi:hypothetical protein